MTKQTIRTTAVLLTFALSLLSIFAAVWINATQETAVHYSVYVVSGVFLTLATIFMQDTSKKEE